MSEMGLGRVKTCTGKECAEFVFSIGFSRQWSPALLVSKSTKSRWNFYKKIPRGSFHTAWVKNGSVLAYTACPFYPQEQTSAGHTLRSVSCQKQKSL